MAAGQFYRNQGKGFLIGVAGGALGGLIGLGGGIVMIPLMGLLTGLTQHQAHGTSLLAIVFTGLIGAVTYAFHGFADWRAALILAVFAMVTARFGALYAHSLPEKKLKKAFGWFLIIVSFVLVFKGAVLRSSYTVGPFLHYVALIGTGAFTGFLSGMMGVGGGGIMVPFLVIFIGMPQHLAQGTSLLAMTPGSAVGALTHYKLGNIARHIGLGLVLGGALGGYIGASFAHLVPEFHLKVIFALVGLWMGIRYIKTV